MISGIREVGDECVALLESLSKEFRKSVSVSVDIRIVKYRYIIVR